MDQVGRVELFCAIVALIAARIFKAAIGAGAFDVAIWQKAAIGLGVDLCFTDLFDQALAGESACEVLCECVVLGAGGTAEVIKAEAEAIGDLGLDITHLGAIVRDRLASLCGGEFGGGSVFVCGAEEEHLMATLAQVAGVEIGGELGADEIAQMFDPVDVGDCRGDEVTCHLGSLCFALWAVFS